MRHSSTPARCASGTMADGGLRKVQRGSAAASWSDRVVDAADEAKSKVEDAVEGSLSTLGRYVTFGSAPEIILRIRKQLRLNVPLLPDVLVTAGTDVPIQREEGRLGGALATYRPNLQWRVSDSWFNGDINLDTANHTVFYEKTFDLDPLQLRVSANFDYKDHEPYVGFQFLTTSGITSPAMTNGFSVRKEIEITETNAVRLSTDVEASLILCGATLGGKSKNHKTLTSHPMTLDFSRVKLDLLLK